MSKKISILSHESSAGRTTLALSLFSEGIKTIGSTIQLMGYDIEKPDLLDVFDKVKFSATEVYADFPRIDKNHCRYCGACIAWCGSNAMTLDRHTPALIIDPDRCEACGDCIEGCNIHGITTRQRLTGYLLHGKLNGHSITIGKGDQENDFLIPLICRMNSHRKTDSLAICDLGPGISGFVLAALRETDMAVIVLKPSRGWTRNIQPIRGYLMEKKIPYGFIINKYRAETGFLEEVEAFCRHEKIPLFGTIPFNPELDNKSPEVSLRNFSDMGPPVSDIWNSLLHYLT